MGAQRRLRSWLMATLVLALLGWTMAAPHPSAGATLDTSRIMTALEHAATVVDRLLARMDNPADPLSAADDEAFKALTTVRSHLETVLAGETPDANQVLDAMEQLQRAITHLDPVADAAAQADLALLQAFRAGLFSFAGDHSSALKELEAAIARDPVNRDLYRQFAETRRLAEHTGVTAFINGVRPQFDVPPRIEDGRTLVPMRVFGEALNAGVHWNAENRQVIMTRDDEIILLTIDSNVAFVNGREVLLDVPATIRQNRTLVPLRFVSESFGVPVEYIDGVVIVWPTS